MKLFRIVPLSLFSVCCLLPAAAISQEPVAAESLPAEFDAAENNEQVLPWLSSLDEGYRQALTRQKPVLIRAGVEWCRTCGKMAREIETPEVQQTLELWTLVYVDADRATEDARKLNVSTVPALRIRTAGGVHVDSHDGYLAPKDLIAWLDEHYKAATAIPDAVLLAAGRPDATAVAQLIEQFEHRNAAVREAAIRRLLPHPDLARPAVVEAFGDGSLAVRLAALELLDQWQAPLGDIDPWDPEAITDERLATLDEWAATAAVKAAAQPKKLSDEQLAAARLTIDRMLRGTAAEAAAIRERLARLGPVLLPEVYGRLKATTVDRDRRRLLALRYRLVTSDSLALQWSGGLERLAATDFRVRQQAAEELADLAGVDDQQLLLELFSDPDPLVREISLRGLQNIGGKAATAALVKLLEDPEPNVRAAVLKQLEETPQQSMVPKIAAHLKTETDADLIVHAVRFLRAAGGPQAVRAMLALLKHESWQVRAEAAAGLSNSETSFGSARSGFSLGLVSVDVEVDDGGAASLQADVYTALIKLLDDPDAFVVAKAIEGVAGADMLVAVEPLLGALEKHPDLAVSIVQTLAGGSKMRTKALPHLRKFTTHKDAPIRAAALGGLYYAARQSMEKELAAGLEDTDSIVRIAAAGVLFRMLETKRQEAVQDFSRRSGGRSVDDDPFAVEFDGDPFGGGIIFEPQPSLMSRAVRMLGIGGKKADEEPATDEPAAEPPGDPEPADEPETDEPAKEPSDEPEPDNEPEPNDEPATPDEPVSGKTDPSDLEPEDPWDDWLTTFYTGTGREKWMTPMIEPLEKMLAAEAAEERLAAAMALVPLGNAEAALPVLLEAVRAEPKLLQQTHQILPWLVWQQRLDTFNQLRPLAEEGNFWQLINAMVEVSDRRAAEPFWKVLADEKTTANVASSLERGLRKAYFGDQADDLDEVLPSQKKELADAARPRALSGAPMQRVVALSLLTISAPDDAVEIAGQIADEPDLDEQLRDDAFQVLLAGKSVVERRKAALDALSDERPQRRLVVIQYFVEGTSALRRLRAGVYLNVVQAESFDGYSTGQPIIPEPPPGVRVEHVRPLLDDANPKIAAYAGYLAAVAGEPAGLKPLLQYWRQHRSDDYQVDRLVYRAIAKLDDSSQLRVLQAIYADLDEYEYSQFYWTIRIMSGREILKFRKQIRDEVGMENLQ